MGAYPGRILPARSGPPIAGVSAGSRARREAARWDYQRDRIYSRTDAELRSVRQRTKARLKRAVRISKEVIYGPRRICPRCQKSGNQMSRTITKHLHDLRFTKSGVTGWIVKCRFQVFRCQHCMGFIPWPEEFWERTKFGRNLAAFAIFDTLRMVFAVRLCSGRELFPAQTRLRFRPAALCCAAAVAGPIRERRPPSSHSRGYGSRKNLTKQVTLAGRSDRNFY